MEIEIQGKTGSMRVGLDEMSHIVTQITTVLREISELVGRLEAGAPDELQHTAYLENLFTKYALLSGFLTGRVPENCVNAQTLAPEWDPSTPRREGLAEAQRFALERVLCVRRTPLREQSVDLRVLRKRIMDLFCVVDEFVEEFEKVDKYYAQPIREALQDARRDLAAS